MSEAIPPDHPLRQLFHSAVDDAFREHREVYDPSVASHFAEDLLPDFVHVDRIYRLRGAEGKRLEELPEMIDVAHEKEGPERRLEVDRYIGDFVLFMTSFFPAAVRRGRWFAPNPLVARVGGILVTFSQPLDYYVAEGRNAYSRAAATARLFAPGFHSLLDQLSSKLEDYLHVLRRVKTILEDDPEYRRMDGIIH